jgi:hypothetical protein
MAWIYPGGLTDTDFADGTTNTAWAIHLNIYGAAITIPSAGTVTKLGAYCKQNDVGDLGLKFGLYTSGGSLVAQSTGTVTLNTLSWVDSGTISGAVSAGTYYVVLSGESSAVLQGYDTSANGVEAAEAYATAMQSSESLAAGDGSTGYRFGVRLDFTAGGSGYTPRSMLLGVG